MLIDGDRFIPYLVFSGLFDEASCGDLKKAIELCTVDAVPRDRIDLMIAEIEESITACENLKNDKAALAIESRESYDKRILTYRHALAIILKYAKEQTE